MFRSSLVGAAVITFLWFVVQVGFRANSASAADPAVPDWISPPAPRGKLGGTYNAEKHFVVTDWVTDGQLRIEVFATYGFEMDEAPDGYFVIALQPDGTRKVMEPVATAIFIGPRYHWRRFILNVSPEDRLRPIGVERRAAQGT